MRCYVKGIPKRVLGVEIGMEAESWKLKRSM